jgi:hypothetical protein
VRQLTQIVTVAIAAAFLLASAADATSCKDPKTHKFIKCPPAAAAPAAPTSGLPHCKTGKPCGKSCIAMSKTCTIK